MTWRSAVGHVVMFDESATALEVAGRVEGESVGCDWLRSLL